MSEATVTSKGQVTIPVEVRRALGLRTGSRLQFVDQGDGTYSLIPATGTVRALKGAVPVLVPRTLEELDRAARAYVVETARG